MKHKLTLIIVLLSCQACAQIGFDRYGLVCGDDPIQELVLNRIENNSNKFKLKITHHYNDGSTSKLKYHYRYKDSILYQKCRDQSNMHKVDDEKFVWIPNPEDTAEYNPYLRSLIEKTIDSKYYTKFERFRVENNDTVLVYETTIVKDSLGKAVQQLTNFNAYNYSKKSLFNYYDNDSIIETIYKKKEDSETWSLDATIVTTNKEDSKVIHETNSDFWIKEMTTTLKYNDGIIEHITIDLIESDDINEHTVETIEIKCT